MLDTHACAIAGCREACPPSHLMCVPHWRMVPAALAREVYRAHDRWRSAVSRASRLRKGCTEETFGSVTELRRVQQLAIDAVMVKLEAKDQRRQEGQHRIF